MEEKILEILLDIQKEQQGMKQDIQGIKQEQQGMKKEQKGIKQEIQGIKNTVERLEYQNKIISNNIGLILEQQIKFNNKLDDHISENRVEYKEFDYRISALERIAKVI